MTNPMSPGQIGLSVAAAVAVLAFAISGLSNTAPDVSTAVGVFAVFLGCSNLQKRAQPGGELLLAFPPLLASIYLLSTVV